MLVFILIYICIVLYLTYFIYSIITKQNKINYIKYISLIKDKDFIFFKDYLFKLYSSTLIILLAYLFKSNSFYLLLDLDNYFLFFILLTYLLLTSKLFILFLFNIYSAIKFYIQLLNEININLNIKNISTFIPFTYLARSFSTSTKNNKLNKNKTRSFSVSQKINFNIELELSKLETKRLKDFKKAYGGGYLGYTKIHNFGHVSQFVDRIDTTNLEH